MLIKLVFIGHIWASFYKRPILAWQAYEEPIKLAAPNSNGVYEFELVLENKLSMFSYDLMSPVFYDPNNQNWLQLNSSFYASCDANNNLVNGQNGNVTILQDALKSVNQFNGKVVKNIAINGKIPGDTIVVPLGAEVIMRVKNRLYTESVTVHVHGINKQDLWFTDGVGFIQQCPIYVNNDYSYRFIADTPGTLFYHGHLSIGRSIGNVGGFVVLKPNETTQNLQGDRLKVVKDYYVLIQDIGVLSAEEQWTTALTKLQKYTNKINDLSPSSNSDSCWSPTKTYDGTTVAYLSPVSAILIGGKGWHSQEDLLNRPSSLPLSTYLINKGEYAKFRFVNAGIGQNIMIWLEQHKLVVVATDGVEVEPYEVDAITIFPGERYDILVQGHAEPKQKNYRFVFETLDRFDWTLQPINKTIGLANLQYNDTTVADTNNVDFIHSSCTLQKKCIILNCPFANFSQEYNYLCKNVGELVNAENITDTEILEQKVFTQGYEEYFINIDHDDGMNGIHFKMPQGMPYYNYGQEDQILSPCNTQADKCPTDNCNCFHHYNLTLGNIVQMTLYNMGKGGNVNNGYTHPFHMHGTHFYVMKLVYPPTYNESGFLDSTSPDIPCNNMTQECFALPWTNSSWLKGNVEGMYSKPTYRDTIIVPTGGYAVIRFRAKNPGWWFAHCHFLVHHLKGMSFAFRIGDHDQIPRPPDGFPRSCGVYEQPQLNLSNNTSSTQAQTMPTQSSDSSQNLATIFSILIVLLLNLGL